VTAQDVVTIPATKGPWHVEPDGRIRNERGQCPLAAATGRWMPTPEIPGSTRVVMAADFPNFRDRALLLSRLGVKGT